METESINLSVIPGNFASCNKVPLKWHGDPHWFCFVSRAKPAPPEGDQQIFFADQNNYYEHTEMMIDVIDNPE